MKKTILIKFGLIFLLLCPVRNAMAQSDTLNSQRYVMRAVMYGVGGTRVLDTYLSPLEYKGIEVRVNRELMRMTRLFDGNVSLQNYFQTYVSYSKNRSETSSEFTGMVNWSIGLHYQIRINDHLKLLAGGLGELNGGFIYNLRNSNNPASAKAYADIAASAMAIYHFKIKRYPMILRYQINLPVMGVMFSPDHMESYYEIFSLGNHQNIIKFTSLHNNPSFRQMLTLDFPVGYAKLRAGYIWDMQQSNVNGLKTHIYSHVFMIGVVKTLYRIKDKNSVALPASVRAY